MVRFQRQPARRSRAAPTDRWRGVNSAQPALDAFLDEELARLGLDDSRLALVGFSQGAMMAMHVGLRRRRAPAAIVSYSGLLVGAEHLGEAKARNARGETPPILLVHGDQDPVIPVDAMFIAMNELAAAEFPCQWHLSMGVAPRHRRRRAAPRRPVPGQGVRAQAAVRDPRACADWRFPLSRSPSA